MDKKNDILDELKSWNSPLADISRAMPYHVPEGYFIGLHSSIQQIINLEQAEDPKLSLTKTMPFEIPQGYFETLADKVLLKAANKELGQAGKAQAFDIPAGYFDQLPNQILAAAKASDNTQKTKVIPLGRNITQRLRWAAAAILMIGLSLGSYTILNRQQQNPESELASLPQNTINEYVEQNIDDFDTDMIENTLAMNNAEPVNNLKDEEIIQYLDETGWEQNIN